MLSEKVQIVVKLENKQIIYERNISVISSHGVEKSKESTQGDYK